MLMPAPVARIGITMQGSRETATFIKNLDKELMAANWRSTKTIAFSMAERARQYAPSSGRAGGIRDNITAKKITNSNWVIMVKTPKEWGSDKSRVAKKIYPMAQERGYKPHWIHINMIPEEVREKYRAGTMPDTNWLFVKNYTPYMVPALLDETNKDERIIRKEIRKAIDRARKRAKANKTGVFGGRLTEPDFVTGTKLASNME
jgi:hypothetical protein